MTETTQIPAPSSRKGVPAALICVLLLSEAIDTFAQYCFKRAAVGEGAPEHLNLKSGFLFAVHVASQGYLWLGVLAIAAVFMNWSPLEARCQRGGAVVQR